MAPYLSDLAESDSKAHPTGSSEFFFRLSCYFSEFHRKRHTYIVGASGSGKSAFALASLIHGYTRKAPHQFATVFVIAPHGDLCEQVAGWKEFGKHPESLIYLSPKPGKGLYPTINPFDLRDRSDGNVDVIAQALAEAFWQLLQGQGTNQMEAFLIPCITVLLKQEGSSLRDLMRFMNDEENQDLVELGKKSSNAVHREFFQTAFYRDIYRGTKASIFSKLLKILGSSHFAHMATGNSTVDLESLLDSRKTVLINLAKGTVGEDTSEAFGRFIVSLIQGLIMKRNRIPEHARIPVHLFIDECHNYLSPSLGRILEEARKFGLHLTLAQQYIGQRMDTEFKRNIMANTAIKLAGKNDPKVLLDIAKTMNIDASAFQRLKTGEFLVTCDTSPTYRLRLWPYLLGNNHASSAKEQERLKAFQNEKYHRNITPDSIDPTSPEVVSSTPSEINPSTAALVSPSPLKRRSPKPLYRRPQKLVPRPPIVSR